MAAPQGYTSLGIIGFTDQGIYDNSTTYYTNDLVHYLGNIYRCKVDETIGVAPGENVNWTVFVGTPTNIVEELIAPVEVSPSANAYTAGRQFIYNDNLYEVVKSIAVGDALVNISDDANGNIKDADRVETQVLQTRKMIAPIEENPSINAYSIGDQLIYNGLLYNVTAAIAIGDSLAVGTNIALSDAVVDQLKTINTTLGDTDISAVGNSVTAAISSLNNDFANISNPNLLDNPWFTINQRGENSYTGFVYTLDRWLNEPNATVNIVSNGITITGNLWQRLENELYEQLISKTCTLSVLLADGTIYHASGSVTSSNGVYITIDNDNVYCTFQKDSSYTFIDLWSKVGANITFRAVKLEIGTISTLSMDTVPNYATELLKCQRYFNRFWYSEVGWAHCVGTDSWAVIAHLPCVMRAASTISLNGTISISVTDNDIRSGTPTIQNYNEGGEPINIGFSLNGITGTVGEVGRVFIGNSYLNFSADL